MSATTKAPKQTRTRTAKQSTPEEAPTMPTATTAERVTITPPVDPATLPPPGPDLQVALSG